MEKSKQPRECPCGLNLGIEQLLTPDVKDFQYLINQPITFQGPCDTSERTMIKTKIKEIKERIGEYYFDKENRLIAIPNQIPLPKNPHLIYPEEEETNSEIRRRNNIFRDKNCEDRLHQSIIKATREMKLHAFVYQGFNSKDCIKAKVEKGKNLRIDQQCKCKPKNVCDCGKEKFPGMNIHENDVMELLDIKKLDDKEIENCSQLLKVLKTRESMLFSKVNILNLFLSKNIILGLKV